MQSIVPKETARRFKRETKAPLAIYELAIDSKLEDQ